MKKITLRILLLSLALTVLTAACGSASTETTQPASADATADCHKITGKCKSVVSNNSTIPFDISIAVDVAYKGSEVQMDDEHLNPVGQTWSNFFYMDSTIAKYHLEPGESLPFEWKGNAGLYRVTVNSTESSENTVVYSYTGYDPSVSESNYYRVSCDPSTLTVTSSAKAYTGWGVAIYINDSRWAVIVDVPGQTTWIKFPKPEFIVDPSRLNIESDKWDNFIEVERDKHLDHTNAAFCSYQYPKVLPTETVVE